VRANQHLIGYDLKDASARRKLGQKRPREWENPVSRSFPKAYFSFLVIRALPNRGQYRVDGFRDGACSNVAFSVETHAHRARGEVALSDDEHRVDFRLLSPQHLSVDFVRGRINGDSHAVGAQFQLDPAGLRHEGFFVADGKDAYLFWR
jgi:hypothetical protein